jgi:hypothetical protein
MIFTPLKLLYTLTKTDIYEENTEESNHNKKAMRINQASFNYVVKRSFPTLILLSTTFKKYLVFSIIKGIRIFIGGEAKYLQEKNLRTI